MWFRGDNVTRNYTVDASHLGVKRLSTGELKLHKICWDRTFFFSTAKISEIKWFKKYTMIWRSMQRSSLYMYTLYITKNDIAFWNWILILFTCWIWIIEVWIIKVHYPDRLCCFKYYICSSRNCYSLQVYLK